MRYDIPESWERQGLVLERDTAAATCSVAGDPCIVWDEDLPGWRMFLFFSPPGRGQAVCRSRDQVGPGQWEFLGPLPFANPEALIGGRTHKPFVVMNAQHPNRAARIDGHYWLATVSWRHGHKVVQRARALRLAGPWVLDPTPVIDLGEADAFDARHVDAVTGYYFPERGEVLYFYMGYPLSAQPRAVSPYGSAQAVAVQEIGAATAQKLGPILPPCQVPGHWASGWVGGLQLLPGRRHRWIAVVNASPTAPQPQDGSVHRQEPPPSLGGFAYCDREWPVKNWEWCPEPIEWVDDIPETAIRDGEGVNLWRQHILCLPNGPLALFYNSGSHGKEQLYLKTTAGRSA